MKLMIFIIWCASLSIPAAHTQRKTVTDQQRRISGSIPIEWDQVQGIRAETILKLRRSGKAGQSAVITVSLDNIPDDYEQFRYDIWSMSDDDIRKAAERGSFLGEIVKVDDVGRGNVEGIHVVWNITHRQIPDSELWEYVFEGIRNSQLLTIRLTSVGDKDWFASNKSEFADFVRDLRFIDEKVN